MDTRNGASREDRERMALALEREAALLRRPEFDVDIWSDIHDDPESRRRLAVSITWSFEDRAAWVETYDEYKGSDYGTFYDTPFVDHPDGDRRAHAYLNAHDPDSGVWFLRIHQSNDSRLGEVWFGGRVLRDARRGGQLRLTRDDAIHAADMWAHHGELPEHAMT